MQQQIDYSDSLYNLIEKIESFEIIQSGKKENILNTNNKFEKIKNNLSLIFKDSILLPAFGVSIHDLTLQEMQSGSWLQINFITQQEKNGLPFNSLLIKLEQTSGLNLIRLYNNKYEGRCLHLNLEKSTDLVSVLN